MMTRGASVKAAKETLDFVFSKRIKSSNKLADIAFQPWNFWGGIVQRIRLEAKEKGKTAEDMYRMYANAALNEGTTGLRFGNCMEKSSIAYFYLKDKGIRPIDLMNFRDDKPNHMFVVVGKDPSSSPSEPNKWGEAAIVCDPWLGEIYDPAQLAQKWRGGIPAWIIQDH